MYGSVRLGGPGSSCITPARIRQESAMNVLGDFTLRTRYAQHYPSHATQTIPLRTWGYPFCCVSRPQPSHVTWTCLRTRREFMIGNMVAVESVAVFGTTTRNNRYPQIHFEYLMVHVRNCQRPLRCDLVFAMQIDIITHTEGSKLIHSALY